MVLNHMCKACGEEVDSRSVRARPGPGASRNGIAAPAVVGRLA
jgi:hypothetical protein